MNKSKSKKLWTATATVILLMSVGLLSLLIGMFDFLKNNNVGADVVQQSNGKIEIIGKPVPVENSETDQGKELFKQGIENINEKKWTAAVTCFQNYKSVSGKNIAFNYFLGFALRRAGKTEEAFDALKTYLENTTPYQSSLRISAAIELMFLVEKENDVKKLQYAVDKLKKLDVEANSRDDGTKESFATAGYLSIYKLGKLTNANDRRKWRITLEALFRPIAGIPRTNIKGLIETYFLRNASYINESLEAGQKEEARDIWNKLEEKRLYILTVLTEDEKKMFSKLEQEMQSSEAPKNSALK